MIENDLDIPNLKENVDTHLQQIGLRSYVQDLILEMRRKECDMNSEVISKEIISRLRQEGILDDVIQNISKKYLTHFGKGSESPLKIEQENVRDVHSINTEKQNNLPIISDTGAKADCKLHNIIKEQLTNYENVSQSSMQLIVQVNRGRAFLDYIIDEPVSSDIKYGRLILYVHHHGQRFWSKPVACTCDPEFNEEFCFSIVSKKSKYQNFGTGDLLCVDGTIHFVLVEVNPLGSRRLRSSQYLDWREVLVMDGSKVHLYLEMMGIGAENNIPIGIIEVQLSLVPKLQQRLSDKVLRAQKDLEQSRQKEENRRFLSYVKNWLKKYFTQKPYHSDQNIKIFVQDENCQTWPVFHFINILELSRPVLETPKEAAWFVSLLDTDYNTTNTFAACAINTWNSTHAFLSLKRGGVENHAVLLCSILLGFGLDAYVVMGLKGTTQWTWVLTRGASGRITFWESTTGLQCEIKNLKVGNEKLFSSYHSIDCVFNDKHFYASLQASNLVENCNYHFEDPSLWKSFSKAEILCVSKSDFNITLVPPSIDPLRIGYQMENKLRKLIESSREDLKLTTNWDYKLCQLLGQVLASFEARYRLGATDKYFEDAISNIVSEDYGFKCVPLRIGDIPARRAFGLFLRNHSLREMITSKEVDAKFAVCVYPYVYPENVVSIWIAVACKYCKSK